MTAIEKMTDMVVNPEQKSDTSNLIRETLRMSSAIRNTLKTREEAISNSKDSK